MSQLIIESYSQNNTKYAEYLAYWASIHHVTIEFEALEETESIFDHFDDKTMANEVADNYVSDSAAWFCAEVTVKYEGLETEQYLGCCSYGSFDEFKNDPNYFEMVLECINEINELLSRYTVINNSGQYKELPLDIKTATNARHWVINHLDKPENWHIVKGTLRPVQ